jgi:hypothetical protein
MALCLQMPLVELRAMGALAALGGIALMAG